MELFIFVNISGHEGIQFIGGGCTGFDGPRMNLPVIHSVIKVVGLPSYGMLMLCVCVSFLNLPSPVFSLQSLAVIG